MDVYETRCFKILFEGFLYLASSASKPSKFYRRLGKESSRNAEEICHNFAIVHTKNGSR